MRSTVIVMRLLVWDEHFNLPKLTEIQIAN